MMREGVDTWQRSSYCASSTCVEVRLSNHGSNVLVRDASGTVVASFLPEEWRELVKGIKAGEFDLA